jgi:transposase
MAFREVDVTEIREVLRAWLAGLGLRRVAERAGVDRKTARRYVQAAEEAGLVRDGGEAQLSDELIGQVVQAVPGGEMLHGLAHFVGESVELGIDPLLEPGEIGIALGK